MPLMLGRSGTQYVTMVTELLTAHCEAQLAEFYCKESNISDTNWLRYLFSSYLFSSSCSSRTCSAIPSLACVLACLGFSLSSQTAYVLQVLSLRKHAHVQQGFACYGILQMIPASPSLFRGIFEDALGPSLQVDIKACRHQVDTDKSLI